MGLFRGKKGAIQPTYEAYENCPFCKHREKPGCFGCAERRQMDERAAAQKLADETRMEVSRIGTFHFDNPEEMATLTAAFSKEALEQHFDASDISDELVLKVLGEGKVENGELLVLLTASLLLQSQSDRTFFGDPRQWTTPKSLDEFKTAVIQKARLDMARERGHARIIAAVKGKPGAGPGTEEKALPC